MSSTSKKNGHHGSSTTLVMTLITFLCIMLIGLSGVIKYKLDRSEISLTSPDSSFTPGQEAYEKTLRALGYGGFLGSAAQVIEKRDRAALADMKQYLKTARDALARLPERTAAGVRHDIDGIISIYAAILDKAEKSFNDNTVQFSTTDLAPAQVSISALDTKLQAALATNRLNARREFRLWGLSLTLISWFSLIIAAGLAAALYLVARNRQAVPLRALAQSVQNITKGDMESRIWGTERSDVVGELARAIDLARYHFSKLPDISLLSEQGPVRIRFEGETRSLFEAMMRNIASEYERACKSNSEYTATLASQRDILTEISARLNSLASQIIQQGVSSQNEWQQLSRQLAASAQSLALAHEKTAAHTSTLVPFLQERAHNMAEVTHIAGKQIVQVLEKLTQAEQELRAGAAQSSETVEKLAANTNQMGERIFAAVNLMQASGKALSEATGLVQSRFNEAVESLGRGEEAMQQIMSRLEDRLGHTAKAEENMASFAARAEANLERMEGSVRTMAERHEQLAEQIVMATTRMEGIVASFDSAQRSMSEAMQQVKRDSEMLSGLLQTLRENNEQLLAGITRNSQTSYEVVQALAEKSLQLLQTMETKLVEHSQNTGMRLEQMASNADILNQQLQTATSSLTQSIMAMREEQERFTSARTRFSDQINNLESSLKQQASSTIVKAEEWAAKSFSKLASLAENMESLMQRLNVLGQLTGTLSTVAGQLGQLMPSLTKSAASSDSSESSKAAFDAALSSMQREMKAGWQETMAYIEAVHDQLSQLMTQQKDQLEMRLVVMDKKIKEVANSGNVNLEQHQIAFMNDIVAMLANINEHLISLDKSIKT